MRRGYFSMIELLVVISIIAILAAMLFPALGKARNKARAIACVSNQRQLGTGATVFAGDNDGACPRGGWGYTWVAGGTGDLGWPMDINEYIKDRSVFACPSATNYAAVPWTFWPYISDYGYNAHINAVAAAAFSSSPLVKLTSTKVGSETPWIHDINKQNNFVFWTFNLGMDITHGQAFGMRHNGGGNVLYLDGHVNWSEYYSYLKTANGVGTTNFVQGTR